MINFLLWLAFEQILTLLGIFEIKNMVILVTNFFGKVQKGWSVAFDKSK
jgi:hypothetical protein